MSSEEYEYRYYCGVNKPASCFKFSQKQQVLDAMCLHYSVLVSLAELEQMRRGLSIQHFNTLMESFPRQMREAFCPQVHEITSEQLQDMFTPLFSTVGSNKRKQEEAIVMMWFRYLQQIG